MAERSREPSRRPEFSRGRLIVGLVLVAIVAGGAAYGLGQLRTGTNPGRVVYATEHGVFVRELASGDERRVASLPKDTLQVWPDADGRWLGYLRRAGSLWLLDLETRERWQVSERLSIGLGWTPDNRFVAGELLSDRDLVAIDPGSRGNDLLVSRYSGGRMIWKDREHFLTVIGKDFVSIRVSGRRPLASKVADDAAPLAVSPEGSEVLYLIDPEGAKPRVAIADLDGIRLGSRRVVFEGWAKLAATSPQGFVAFSARDRSNKWGTWVLESSSKPPRRVADGAEELGWSRNGSALVYVIDGALYARDLNDARPVRLSARGTYVKGFAVVP